MEGGAGVSVDWEEGLGRYRMRETRGCSGRRPMGLKPRRYVRCGGGKLCGARGGKVFGPAAPYGARSM